VAHRADWGRRPETADKSESTRIGRKVRAQATVKEIDLKKGRLEH
jgi:hypothetical protein